MGKKKVQVLAYDPQSGISFPGIDQYSIRILNSDILLFEKGDRAFRTNARKCVCTCPAFVFKSYLLGLDTPCVHLLVAKTLVVGVPDEHKEVLPVTQQYGI